MPRARRGGPSGPLKSAVTKGVTSSKSSRGGKRGLAGVVAKLGAKKSVPNRGSSRAGAAQARAVANRPVGTAKREGGAGAVKLNKAGGKRKPSPKGKPKGKGFKRIKGAIITRRAGG